MSEKGTGRPTKKGTGEQMKTRCYYTDYVNHMVRFYLSTPNTLPVSGKRRADIENWIAVQDVWRKLCTEEQKTLETIYRLTFKVSDGVDMYCKKTGADSYKTWVLVTKTVAAIARRRGLV